MAHRIHITAEYIARSYCYYGKAYSGRYFLFIPHGHKWTENIATWPPLGSIAIQLGGEGRALSIGSIRVDSKEKWQSIRFNEKKMAAFRVLAMPEVL